MIVGWGRGRVGEGTVAVMEVCGCALTRGGGGGGWEGSRRRRRAGRVLKA